MHQEVFFTSCRDYENELPEALERLCALCGWPSEAGLRGRRVLIKPNLLTDRTPQQAVTTHPALLRQVIRLLQAAGATISVGDSPASIANIRQVWERTGIAAVCAEAGVPLIMLESDGARTFERSGFRFSIARRVLEADLLVNLPKVKSHSLTLLTAAVKNLYGAIPGYAKTMLHRQHPSPRQFGRLVKDIWEVLPPSFTIADAVVGMEGAGPANGTPVELGFLAASVSPFALDRALCAVLGIKPARVPYLAAQPRAEQVVPRMVGEVPVVESFKLPVGGYLLDFIPPRLARATSTLLWVRPAFDASACKRCNLCVKACPVEALRLPATAPAPLLDQRRCISCSCCHEVCPHNAIEMAQAPLLRFLRVFKGLG